jgi:anaerobic selenocysteine-containing dehydrogenase
VSTRTVARQCPLCEAHCGILVHVDDGPGGERVTGIEGNPTDVLSAGYLCPKGTTLGDLHTDPDRLRRPMRRVGDGFEECSWDEAFTLIGDNLRRIRAQHGRDAIGVYIGNPTAHSPAVLYLEVLRRALRTRNVYAASSVDQFPQYLVANQMLGNHGAFPIADIDRTDLLLIMGANPAVSNGSITTMPDARGRIKAVRKRGGTVVVVDPRRTETVRLADQHVAVRPGGDPYLLLGMLHVLFADGQAPARHLDGLMTGWEEIAELVAEWTPERAAPLAGVDAEVIRDLARAFADARSAVAYARIGVCHHTTGSITHWLVNVLNAVTGNLDRPGGQMFATPPVDVLQLLRTILPKTGGQWHSRVSGLPELGGELPTAVLAEEMLTPGKGQIRAMIVVAGNPCLSLPGSDRIDEGFANLDFQVSIDMYVTETSRHADVILPPTSHLERSEFDLLFPFLSVRNNARYSPAVFDPPADGKDDCELLLDLAAELLPRPPIVNGVTARVARTVGSVATPDRVSALLVAVGPQGILRRGIRGLTLGRVKRTRGGVDLGPLEPGRLRRILRTPDRRVHLAPAALVAETRRLSADAASELEAGRADATYDLQLIGRRHLRSNNSWLHNIDTMVKGRDRCTALMHPDDAEARDLEDGQRVLVASPRGQVEVPLEVSDEIRPGVVAIPHGWGHDVKDVGWSTAAAHAGANVNVLHDPALTDRLSHNGAMNATWVRVTAASEALAPA